MRIYKSNIGKLAFTFVVLVSICILIYLKEESTNKESPKKATFVLNTIEERIL
ncbi:MAG: hypothetical protein AB2375_00480 [Tissierellaceae bacterium]